MRPVLTGIDIRLSVRRRTRDFTQRRVPASHTAVHPPERRSVRQQVALAQAEYRMYRPMATSALSTHDPRLSGLLFRAHQRRREIRSPAGRANRRARSRPAGAQAFSAACSQPADRRSRQCGRLGHGGQGRRTPTARLALISSHRPTCSTTQAASGRPRSSSRPWRCCLSAAKAAGQNDTRYFFVHPGPMKQKQGPV